MMENITLFEKRTAARKPGADSLATEMTGGHETASFAALARAACGAKRSKVCCSAVSEGIIAHKLVIKLKTLLHQLSPVLTLRGYPWSCPGFSDEMAPLASVAFERLYPDHMNGNTHRNPQQDKLPPPD